jgi:hypothetical protein
MVPQLYYPITLTKRTGENLRVERRVEKAFRFPEDSDGQRERASRRHQLEAFVDKVKGRAEDLVF